MKNGSPICSNGWLADLKARHYTDASIINYRERIGKFVRFMETLNVNRVQDITEKDLVKYRLSLVEENLSSNTIICYSSAVRSFFKWLEENAMIFINPAENMILPRSDKKIQFVPTVDEMTELLKLPDISTPTGIRNRALIEFMYSTAARRNEIVQMNMGDINLKDGMARLYGKGRKERMVPMGRHSTAWMKRYLTEARDVLLNGNDDDALWVSATKQKRITGWAVQQILRSYSNINPHAVRRAAATHLLANGADPAHIAEMLGHANLKSLKQYLKVTVDDMRKFHGSSRLGQ